MRWFDFRNPLSLEPLVAETIFRAFCIGYRGMLDFEVGSLGVDVPANMKCYSKRLTLDLQLSVFDLGSKTFND